MYSALLYIETNDEKKKNKEELSVLLALLSIKIIYLLLPSFCAKKKNKEHISFDIYTSYRKYIPYSYKVARRNTCYTSRSLIVGPHMAEK